MKEVACFKCHNSWSFTPPLGRKDECPNCNWDAHVCMNCTHYDPHAHHECREPQTEYVHDKERSNFCDYFEPTSSQSTRASDLSSQKDKLEQLFSKPGEKIQPDAPAKGKSLADELQDFLKNK